MDSPGSARAPRLLTMRQAAECLAVSYWTVRTWVESGKVRAVRLPGQRLLRIEVTELARFVEEHRDASPDAPGWPR